LTDPGKAYKAVAGRPAGRDAQAERGLSGSATPAEKLTGQPSRRSHRGVSQGPPDLGRINAEAHNNLGNRPCGIRQLRRSHLLAYRTAAQFKPGIAGLHNNLGNALKDNASSTKPYAAYRRAIQLKRITPKLTASGECLEGSRGNSTKPSPLSGHRHQSRVCGSATTPSACPAGSQGRFDEGIGPRTERALESNRITRGHSNLGRHTWSAGGSMTRSFLRRAAQLKTDYASNILFCFCSAASSSGAWPLYARAMEAARFASPKRNFPQPMWDGRPLDGRACLIQRRARLR